MKRGGPRTETSKIPRSKSPLGICVAKPINMGDGVWTETTPDSVRTMSRPIPGAMQPRVSIALTHNGSRTVTLTTGSVS